MANLYICFGRAQGDPPVMVARSQRSAVLQLTPTGQPQPAATPVQVTSTMMAVDIDTAIDCYTEVDCWVDIGPNPNAGLPGTAGNITSFFMARGERVRKAIDKGDKVSAIAV
jgi:hypothetical protein